MSKIQKIILAAIKSWFPDQPILYDYRPGWLFGMEIDIYLPNQKIAIEVQGRQHRLYCPAFHASKEDFQKQRERDVAKHRLMKQQGIVMFVVHESDSRVLGGIQTKLRTHTRFYIKRLKWLDKAWQNHRRILSKAARHEWIMFKCRRGGLLPINKASSQWLKDRDRVTPSVIVSDRVKSESRGQTTGLINLPQLDGAAVERKQAENYSNR